jgi:hypothetical protein
MQGSLTQSASTFSAIKRALEASTATYQDRDFEVFLQDPHGNDTNIRRCFPNASADVQ